MLQGKKKATKKRTVRIKIDKLNSWITLGICIKQRAIDSNYYFDTGNNDHGAFVISYDGYTWIHGKSDSSDYNQWTFEQESIISMTFDPKQKIIKYEKQNSDLAPFQIKYQPQPGQELYFCVTLNSHDQCVSIIG